MNICTYSYEEYLHLVKSFHGTLAPGLLIGGFMVDLAMKHLPEGEFFDAVCETPVCLPDAVQILTPCTIGNGWLSVVSFGKFAITLYEKYGGRGVRVYLDTGKLNQWPEIRDWYLKKKKKNEQNSELLFARMRDMDCLASSTYRWTRKKCVARKWAQLPSVLYAVKPTPPATGKSAGAARGTVLLRRSNQSADAGKIIRKSCSNRAQF
jgi:hypothetical protein